MIPLQIEQFPRHKEIEKGLLDYSAKLQLAYPGRTLDVMTKGWCSPKREWEDCPELAEIKKFFRERLPWREWEILAWFNVMEIGGSIGIHNHYQAEFACAYHIKGPSGLLFDSDEGINLIAPTPGRMAIFPGLLNHSVPEPCAERRFSISMNAHDIHGPLKVWRHERRL